MKTTYLIHILTLMWALLSCWGPVSTPRGLASRPCSCPPCWTFSGSAQEDIGYSSNYSMAFKNRTLEKYLNIETRNSLQRIWNVGHVECRQEWGGLWLDGGGVWRRISSHPSSVYLHFIFPAASWWAAELHQELRKNWTLTNAVPGPEWRTLLSRQILALCGSHSYLLYLLEVTINIGSIQQLLMVGRW